MSPDNPRRQFWLIAGAFVWLACVASGLSIVWAYDNTPGAGANAPVRWPAASVLARATDRPTLVFLAHPRCPCTRASLEELSQLLAGTTNPPKTFVLLLKPEGFADGWERTGLWARAAALRNVTLIRDDAGVEARRFGVATSGQTLLYDRGGALMFSGGITGSRGHAGNNAGEAALASLLVSGTADRRASSVFGCPLF